MAWVDSQSTFHPRKLNEPQRGIRAGSLWLNGPNRANNRLATLYQAPGWLFDSLEDCFYRRAFGS